METMKMYDQAVVYSPPLMLIILESKGECAVLVQRYVVGNKRDVVH